MTVKHDPAALREKLLRLTYIYAYQKGSFILSSGRRSSYYINGKQVTMSAAGLQATAGYILGLLQERRSSAVAVGGLTLGADPIAAAVSALSLGEKGGTPLSCFIVRKEVKQHGTGLRIEGPFYRGIRTVIVDDVLTTGSSVLGAADAVRESGGSVERIFVLVDRQEGGREAVDRAGHRLEAVMTRADLEELQRRMEQLYPGLFASLQEETIRWSGVPWGEVSPRHPSLAGRLEQASGLLAKQHQKETPGRAEIQRAARLILGSVKAAELHPAGEAEALTLLEQLNTGARH